MTATSFWAAGFLVGLLGLAFGCDYNSPVYISPDGSLEVGGASPDGGEAPNLATVTVDIAFRAPTPAEQQALDADSARLGFAVPWLRRSDLALEVLYTITNLDDQPGVAQILVNGANEMVNYDVAGILAYLLQMAAGDDEDVVVLPLIQGLPVMIAPHASAQGVVREDDFFEAELDLDAIGRWSAPAPAVLINRSEVSRAGLDQMPAAVITPAMFRIAVSCTANRHMRCEYLVRLRDAADRLWNGTGPRFMPTPMDYRPPAMMGN